MQRWRRVKVISFVVGSSQEPNLSNMLMDEISKEFDCYKPGFRTLGVGRVIKAEYPPSHVGESPRPVYDRCPEFLGGDVVLRDGRTIRAIIVETEPMPEGETIVSVQLSLLVTV